MTVKKRPSPPNTPRLFLFSLICLIGMLLLSACTEADGEFLIDLAESWAQEKGLLTADGTPDYVNIGVLYGKKSLFGTTGDSDVDAALTAGPVVKNVKDADQLAEQGAMMGGQAGLDKIDEAIEKRPEDWRYWEQKGALLLAEGRADEAQQAFENSDGLVNSRIADGGDCKMYMRNLLYQRQDALTTQIQRFYDLGQDPPADIVNGLNAVQSDIDHLNDPGGPCGG